MAGVKECIANIQAFTPAPKTRTTELFLPAVMTGEEWASILAALKSAEMGLSFFDALHPSGSDPGAYLDYEWADPALWNMTLGNHGWTGGIYQIAEATLVRQLQNLHRCAHLKSIRFGHVALFRHYETKSDEDSAAKDAELRALHAS